MLKILTVLLLCGLLPFQEATAQEGSLVTAEINLKDLERILSELLNGVLKGLVGGEQGSSTGGTSDKQNGLQRGLLGRRRRALLGGVLGGQSNLLGGVLGGQGGLLEGVLGGNEDLLRNLPKLLNMKIADAKLLDLKLKTLPDVGLELTLRIRLEILSNSKTSGPLADLLHVLVDVDVKASLQIEKDKSGALKLVIKDCLTDPVHIKLLSGTLLGNVVDVLSNALNGLLPSVLCPVVELVLNLVNTLLGTGNIILGNPDGQASALGNTIVAPLAPTLP